jgi:predicted DCC family thiol-disulfide oxidoreductase YuxK
MFLLLFQSRLEILLTVLIAKNRYELFGKREANRIPAPEERNKFS